MDYLDYLYILLFILAMGFAILFQIWSNNQELEQELQNNNAIIRWLDKLIKEIDEYNAQL